MRLRCFGFRGSVNTRIETRSKLLIRLASGMTARSRLLHSLMTALPIAFTVALLERFDFPHPAPMALRPVEFCRQEVIDQLARHLDADDAGAEH